MSHGKQRCQGAGTVRRRLWATIFIRHGGGGFAGNRCSASESNGEIDLADAGAHGQVFEGCNSAYSPSSVVCDGEQLYVTFPTDKQVFLTTLGMDGKVLCNNR